MDVCGPLQLEIQAAKDLLPAKKLLVLDMLLIELHHVDCEDDLIEACISTVSIAEIEGRWFLGLWAGRLINVCRRSLFDHV